MSDGEIYEHKPRKYAKLNDYNKEEKIFPDIKYKTSNLPFISVYDDDTNNDECLLFKIR